MKERGDGFLDGFPKGKEKAKARERFLGEIEKGENLCPPYLAT